MENEAVFVIFISKALHFNKFFACFIYCQLYSDGKRKKNATVALQVNATLGDNDGRGGGGGGVSAATLFYKFRTGALTVHAKQVNKQR